MPARVLVVYPPASSFLTFQVVLSAYTLLSKSPESIPLFSRNEQSTRIWDIERYSWFNGELCCSPTLMTFEGVFSRLVISSTLGWLRYSLQFPKPNTRVKRSDDLCKCLRQEVGSWTSPPSAFVIHTNEDFYLFFGCHESEIMKPYAHCSRSVSKIDLRSQQKFQWHMNFWGKSYQKIENAKISTEGT